MHPTLSARTEQLLRTLAERHSVTVEEILQDREGKGVDSGRGNRAKRSRAELVAGQLEISERCAALPVLDARTPEEIIGYNDQGVFD
jgi:hypothetical protein